MAIKERHCWACGESMGPIDSRHYDRRDTCGKLECAREERDVYHEEREQAHHDLDDRMGW